MAHAHTLPGETLMSQPVVAIDWLQRELPDADAQREYAQQRVIVVITEAIAEAMERSGLTRADIATKLERTKGHISQVLSGRRNMTLRTLGDLLWACNLELESLGLVPLGQLFCSQEAAREWLAPGCALSMSEPQDELEWTLSDDAMHEKASSPASFYEAPTPSGAPPNRTLWSGGIENHVANLDLALAA